MERRTWQRIRACFCTYKIRVFSFRRNIDSSRNEQGCRRASKDTGDRAEDVNSQLEIRRASKKPESFEPICVFRKRRAMVLLEEHQSGRLVVYSAKIPAQTRSLALFADTSALRLSPIPAIPCDRF